MAFGKEMRYYEIEELLMQKRNKDLIENIAEYLKVRQADLEQYVENFNRQTIKSIEDGSFLNDAENLMGQFNPSDPIVRKAIEICISKGKFSTGILQTYLGKSYGFIARLAIWLEKIDVIGPMNGNKPRNLLITSMDEFDKLATKNSN